MENRPTKIAFIILFLVLIVAFARILKPFFIPAFLGLLIVIIFNPIYGLFLRLVGGKRYLASFFTTILVSLCIITPFAIIVGIIMANMNSVIHYISIQLQSGEFSGVVDQANLWVAAKASEYSDWLPSDFNLRAELLVVLASLSKVFYQYSPRVVAATASMISGVFLMVIFMFALFAQGPNIYRTIISLTPLKDEHKDILSEEIRRVISGTFLGMVATAIAQGILIGIGFAIAGISNPVVWGLVAIGVTMIPVVGGPLMYVPAAIGLIITGDVGWGIFILVYGIGLVSMADNFIKPLVMRGAVHVNPLLLALCLVGGGLWLGPVGIIIGPLVGVLLLSMIDIYQREFT
ncbi:MAG: hypothetical protein COV46_08575 [Deltaproteobacteria bacterium CG11_big_fil_rev_8_21_14_0_20_49_13]|nr:MAG: hypothetical protein COV46_08575 [Deltaproteobacteria bacterium CG11_big_fil_rev_8_21_14_0_20_49_13]